MIFRNNEENSHVLSSHAVRHRSLSHAGHAFTCPAVPLAGFLSSPSTLQMMAPKFPDAK